MRSVFGIICPRNNRIILGASAWLAIVQLTLAGERLIDAPRKAPYHVWPSIPPAGCPFEKSAAIVGFGFTGRSASYTGADTWYPSWASDGNLYSPWTDGNVEGIGSFSGGTNATTGYATIIGDDPLKLKHIHVGTVRNNPRPYGGRYPCGSLVYMGVWYYGTYCLMNENASLEPMVKTDQGEINWGVFGPFVGFRCSTDFGKSWMDTPCTPSQPLFGEPQRLGGPVKMGSPHFVDFGRNMEHSPDGKAYLVAHGALEPDAKPRIANASWITGDQIFLARVKPGLETINDASKYEFFAGHDASGQPLWTADFGTIKPLVDWNNNCGCVTMTYNAPLKKYLLCVTDGGNTVSRFNTFILESDQITGPWKLVTYMKHFGEQGYFVNIPSKFISADGRTAWLCYAANFTGGWAADPPGSRYGMCLQEIRLLNPTDDVAENPLWSSANVARRAKLTAGSVHSDYNARGAVDGVVDGFPGDIQREWASQGEKNTALLRLTWPKPQTISCVWLFDRPNTLDQITAGLLVFSDGATLATGALPDDAKHGLEVTFPPRTVTWLAFIVTGAKNSSQNIGLSEIAVFATGSP